MGGGRRLKRQDVSRRGGCASLGATKPEATAVPPLGHYSPWDSQGPNPSIAPCKAADTRASASVPTARATEALGKVRKGHSPAPQWRREGATGPPAQVREGTSILIFPVDTTLAAKAYSRCLERTARYGELEGFVETKRHTARKLPARTELSIQRVPSIRTTQSVAAAQLYAGVRLGVEADHDLSEDDAREKRISAALWMVQAIQGALQRRLEAVAGTRKGLFTRIVSGSQRTRQHWIGLLDTQPCDTRSGKQLRSFLSHGRLPSLAVIGCWVCEPFRLRPLELRDQIAGLLGIPVGIENDVRIAGILRNTIAHREEYEGGLSSIDPEIRQLVLLESSEGLPHLSIPDETILWLEWLGPSLLERQLRERPTGVIDFSQTGVEQVGALRRLGRQ